MSFDCSCFAILKNHDKQLNRRHRLQFYHVRSKEVPEPIQDLCSWELLACCACCELLFTYVCVIEYANQHYMFALDFCC